MRTVAIFLLVSFFCLGQPQKKVTATRTHATVQPRTQYKAQAVKATPARATIQPRTTYKGQAMKATPAQPSRTQATRSYRKTYYRPVPRPVVQQQPSADRYREIQQALVQKGYLKSEPSGTWDNESVAALNRFKQDQNLKADSKLDSLALIGLGLGPRHSQPAATTVQPQEPVAAAAPVPE